MNGVANKVALITGASSGIGRATALRLAASGIHVALAARTASALDEVAAEIEAQGGKALAVPTDVTEAEQCRLAVERTVERFGRLDILVCSAGVSMRSLFEKTDLAAMAGLMQVNFFGTLYPTYHAIPHIKTSRGSLIAISSLVGKRGTPTYAVYGASKFAVQGLYASLRLELAEHGIHVGTLSPGFVETPLRDRVLSHDGKPWTQPIPQPFRVHPVEVCVDRIVDLIEHRWAEAFVPNFVGSLLTLDAVLGPWLGDRIVTRHFRKHPLPDVA
jgi:NAD(P)-dependent dehydrogenase (short-subunit alcohol dehydrogenase family)